MAATTNSIAFSTQVTHIGSGASLAPGAISGSADISTALAGSGNLARYPRCDVELTLSPTASNGSASTAIYLYRRDINSGDSTPDDPIPQTNTTITYKQKLAGIFVLPSNTTASTTSTLTVRDVQLTGEDCEFYIENGISVNIPAGWTLKVRPKTDVFA